MSWPMPGVSERPIKDPEQERPVPLVWRPVLRDVVEAIRLGDASLASAVPSVARVAPETAEQIREYVAEYGELVVALPEASWKSSVALWMGSWWDVLIDLWTESEGRSDLVLHLRVFEHGTGYRFEVGQVYVP
jgi:hypothetical protein